MAGQTRPAAETWWVEQQHDEFKVVHGPARPDHAVEPGERIKRVHGPFRSKALAENYASKSEARTMRAKHEKRVR